jgi:glucose-6-phosphate 1-dehydrogenase
VDDLARGISFFSHSRISFFTREETMAATVGEPVGAWTGPGQRPADVFVAFGITADPAKVITFRSLYWLEQRSLLQCQIVGVAVDKWTVDQLVRGARESIESSGEPLDPMVFARFAGRLCYVQGDLGDAGTYDRVAEAIMGADSPVFYLEIPPLLLSTVVKGLVGAGLTQTGRIVVEKPFGTDRSFARALAQELNQYVDECQLYRIDHYRGQIGLEEILYGRGGLTDHAAVEVSSVRAGSPRFTRLG